MKFAKDSLSQCGENVQIHFPCTLGHPEMIEIGEDTVILKDARFQVYPENSGISGKIRIGKRCLLNMRECIMAGCDVTIGDDVIMASDCVILSENHGMNPEDSTPYMDQVLDSKPTSIGDGCWLGARVIVMPGVNIGKRCIIGGGAIVTSDIPDYSIAVGSPAKVIKTYNFDKHEWQRV